MKELIPDIDAFFDFIKHHSQDDVARLRLKKWQAMPFPVDLAITQIEARKRMTQKLPDWMACDRIIIPSMLSTEQCSSEATARYKQNLLLGSTFCDLTGGMGVDTYYMAQRAEKATYVEQNADYCTVARHNYAALQQNNITVINSDCRQFLAETECCYDTIYIDPARRGDAQERVYAIADCEPNVIAMLPMLLKRCKRLIIKLSTMVDIGMVREELAVDCHIHVVSLRNECKEVLAVINAESKQKGNSLITCALINKNNYAGTHTFDLNKEPLFTSTYAESVGSYLYEPDVALLKAGVFKSISERFEVEKLHASSHLYTSNMLRNEFAGRQFKVTEVIPFSSKICKTFARQYPACNITTRNFPLSSAALRQKLKVGDGGDIYLFATTCYPNEKVLIVCRKA